MNLLMPLLSTCFIVLSAVLMAFGLVAIKKGKRKVHERYMVAAAICAICFFILYISRTVIFGSTPFNGPDALKTYYLIFLLSHIMLATVAFVMGVVTITLAFRGSFLKHRKLGPPTAVVWFITAATGVTVYVILYIAYPPAETTTLWNAIFG